MKFANLIGAMELKFPSEVAELDASNTNRDYAYLIGEDINLDNLILAIAVAKVDMGSSNNYYANRQKHDNS